MGQQEASGKKKQLVGRGKEMVGIPVGDSELELEGDREHTEGDLQESLGKARQQVGAFVDRAAEAIKK